ncbi:MAG TPA: phosphoenolpyruvate--protein phosphotransferase [Vicinamibacterales bacterium]
MRRIEGVGVAGGLATGRAVLLVRRGRALRVPVPPDRVDEEVTRLERARERSRQQIATIREQLAEGPGAELAPIFDAQLLMLDDPLLVGRARALIREEGVNAEWAVQRAFEEVETLFENIDDPYLQDRRGDVADVAGRLRLNLREGSRGWQDLLAHGDGPFVLVADDPPPSVTAQVDWSRVTGLAIDAGSRTSHTAILARSLGIPTVVGLGEATAHVRPGTTVLVDGTAGELVIDPPAELVAERRAREAQRAQASHEPAAGPALTRDRQHIRLEANVDRVGDVEAALRAGAEGIGLFRSEFLLIDDTLPGLVGPESEEAQVEVYRRLITAMAPRPVTIRTFDLDEAQAVRAQLSDGNGEEADRHQVLGLRGIRLGLANPALLDTQLRAILRAANGSADVRILLPFVTSAREVASTRNRLEQVRRELDGEAADARVQLGAMIEVPAAALAADHLAEVSDFLAIGTNDLVQYLLAADRTDERLAPLAGPTHPALLRVLRTLPRLARRHGAAVSVCGELASEPVLLALLMGLGFDEFSMNPVALRVAREVVHASDVGQLRRLARTATRTGDLGPLEQYVVDALGRGRAVMPA